MCFRHKTIATLKRAESVRAWDGATLGLSDIFIILQLCVIKQPVNSIRKSHMYKHEISVKMTIQ